MDDYERHFDWTMADPPFWGRREERAKNILKTSEHQHINI